MSYEIGAVVSVLVLIFGYFASKAVNEKREHKIGYRVDKSLLPEWVEYQAYIPVILSNGRRAFRWVYISPNENGDGHWFFEVPVLPKENITTDRDGRKKVRYYSEKHQHVDAFHVLTITHGAMPDLMLESFKTAE